MLGNATAAVVRTDSGHEQPPARPWLTQNQLKRNQRELTELGLKELTQLVLNISVSLKIRYMQ